MTNQQGMDVMSVSVSTTLSAAKQSLHASTGYSYAHTTTQHGASWCNIGQQSHVYAVKHLEAFSNSTPKAAFLAAVLQAGWS